MTRVGRSLAILVIVVVAFASSVGASGAETFKPRACSLLTARQVGSPLRLKLRATPGPIQTGIGASGLSDVTDTCSYEHQTKFGVVLTVLTLSDSRKEARTEFAAEIRAVQRDPRIKGGHRVSGPWDAAFQYGTQIYVRRGRRILNFQFVKMLDHPLKIPKGLTRRLTIAASQRLPR
jgi:hypothetical protein